MPLKSFLNWKEVGSSRISLVIGSRSTTTRDGYNARDGIVTGFVDTITAMSQQCHGHFCR